MLTYISLKITERRLYRNRIDIISILIPPYGMRKVERRFFRYNDKYVDKDDLYKHSKVAITL